jgi:hypothetical protein
MTLIFIPVGGVRGSFDDIIGGYRTFIQIVVSEYFAYIFCTAIAVQ